MACNVTRGRAINCKDIQGGISAFYLTDFGGYGTITESSGEITNMSATFTAFKYDVNGAGNSFTTTATSSKDTGTTFFSTTLSVTLPKLSKEDFSEIKLIAFARPHIVVADRNGNAFLIGKDNGCSLVTATMASGDARGDMSGLTLEFVADEAAPPNFISNPITGNPFAGLSSANETITVGTNS